MDQVKSEQNKHPFKKPIIIISLIIVALVLILIVAALFYFGSFNVSYEKKKFAGVLSTEEEKAKAKYEECIKEYQNSEYSRGSSPVYNQAYLEDACYLQALDLSDIKINENHCSKISNEQVESKCYLEAAKETKDTSLCDKILQYSKRDCVVSVAVKTEDDSLCNDLESQTDIDWCRESYSRLIVPPKRITADCIVLDADIISCRKTGQNTVDVEIKRAEDTTKNRDGTPANTYFNGVAMVFGGSGKQHVSHHSAPLHVGDTHTFTNIYITDFDPVKVDIAIIAGKNADIICPMLKKTVECN